MDFQNDGTVYIDAGSKTDGTSIMALPTVEDYARRSDPKLRSAYQLDIEWMICKTNNACM